MRASLPAARRSFLRGAAGAAALHVAPLAGGGGAAAVLLAALGGCAAPGGAAGDGIGAAGYGAGAGGGNTPGGVAPGSRNDDGTGTAAPVPWPRPGTTAAYDLVNGYNGRVAATLELTVAADDPLRVRFVRRTLPDAGSLSSPGDDVQAVFAAPWQMLVDPTFDMLMRFDAPVPLLPSGPLRIGQAEAMRTTYHVTGNSTALRWQQVLRVAGAGPVATPAGTFDCVRVQRDVVFQHSDPFRHDSRRSDTIWFSVQRGVIVRRHWSGTFIHETSADLGALMRRPEDDVTWMLRSLAG